MDKFIKQLIVIILFAIFCMPVSYAEDLMHTTGSINHEFSMSKQPEYVYLKNSNEIVANNEVIIPKNSVLKLKTLCARKERRWHKSGFILTKLESYTAENSDIPYNISEENIYLAVRKYEPINKKEAAILATEIIVFTGASYYAPGVDIAYFFTKGAILRQKHHNWFKAGVYNAYDNSIFWFWLKGKPIELEKDSKIKIQSVDEGKIDKLTSQINKYNEKQEFKAQKKRNNKLKKETKNVLNSQKEFDEDIENEVSKFQNEISEENQINLKEKKTRDTEKELLKVQKEIEKEQSEKAQFRKAKKQYKISKKELKRVEKKYKKAIKETSNTKKTEKQNFKALKKQVKREKKNIDRIIKVQEHIEKRALKQEKKDTKKSKN